MAEICDYTLTEILKDVRKFDINSLPDYVESVVMIMQWHYDKKEFNNEIIKESQSKDMAVMDYILESYQGKYKN
jgi:isocitrate lyase